MKWVDGKFEAQKEQVWDCAVIYPPAVPKMDCEDPVEDGANCSDSGCCKTPGSICFKKNDDWASCQKRCWTNKLWEDGKWAEKDHQIWDCGVIEPKKKTLRLYEMSDAKKEVADQVASQPWVASRPWLAALVLGIVAGGSVAAFRSRGHPQLREVPQASESGAQE